MLQGSSRKVATSFLEEIKEFSELGDSFEEPVKNYSAGMRARLGIAIAMHSNPELMILDEVFDRACP